MLNYFQWSFENGSKSAIELDYVPMPENTVKLVQQLWKSDISVAGDKVWQAQK
jgi:phosphate transport system substrate-binding protein